MNLLFFVWIWCGIRIRSWNLFANHHWRDKINQILASCNCIQTYLHFFFFFFFSRVLSIRIQILFQILLQLFWSCLWSLFRLFCSLDYFCDFFLLVIISQIHHDYILLFCITSSIHWISLSIWSCGILSSVQSLFESSRPQWLRSCIHVTTTAKNPTYVDKKNKWGTWLYLGCADQYFVAVNHRSLGVSFGSLAFFSPLGLNYGYFRPCLNTHTHAEEADKLPFIYYLIYVLNTKNFLDSLFRTLSPDGL